MMKADGIENFGRLGGDFNVPVGKPGSPYIIASPTGNAIKSALRLLPQLHPGLRVYQYALMPDHLHIVIAAETRLDEPIGKKIARFKRKSAEFANVDSLFKPGFNDQILFNFRSLDTVFRYLRDNPRRLAVRRERPDYFRRVNGLEVAGRRVQAYGNLFLLRCPFREQVVVHRADSEAVRSRNRERWLHAAANGGVLVSPFISPDEKTVRTEAEEAGGKIILITHEAMPERYKPAARDFALCEEGRLLIISIPDIDSAITRAACLTMNTLAEEICRI